MKAKRCICLSVVVLLIAQLLGCGTLIYPERRGNNGSKVDIQVAILDGLGLLLFIIPGVIAYAVDFTTGAIYLPGGSKHSGHSEMRIVKIKPGEINRDRIDQTIREFAGQPVDFCKAEIYKISRDDVDTKLSELASSGFENTGLNITSKI